jgi:methionyl-tRNA formyltransferase
LRTVYLGTSKFAASVLERLADSDHRPALVVTPPDSRRGRGRTLAKPPAAETALELGIELLQTGAASDADAAEAICATAPEVGVVCAFGQILREPLLAELELLNVHPSLLPRWRGAAPIERAIMAGDAETGVTIMRVTAGLDSGPIALRETVTIGDADYGALAPRLAALGGDLLVRALDLRAAGELELEPQDDAAATYAEKIEPSERRLDPALPAIELERTVRALSPHVGAYVELGDGERLGVLRARAVPGELPTGSFDGAGGLVLGCADGALRLVEVRPAGGRAMDGEAYVRGRGVPRAA